MLFKAAGKADFDIAFKGRRRPARNQVDCATERIGAVADRAEAFGDLNGRQIGGGETIEIDIAVIRDINRNTVNEQRRLANIKAAQENRFFIARVVRDGHPGQ